MGETPGCRLFRGLRVIRSPLIMPECSLQRKPPFSMGNSPRASAISPVSVVSTIWTVVPPGSVSVIWAVVSPVSGICVIWSIISAISVIPRTVVIPIPVGSRCVPIRDTAAQYRCCQKNHQENQQGFSHCRTPLCLPPSLAVRCFSPLLSKRWGGRGLFNVRGRSL